jgi:hypothetical protein
MTSASMDVPADGGSATWIERLIVEPMACRASADRRSPQNRHRGLVVRAVGLEPTLLAEPDFESGASTSFTTPARPSG